MTYSRLSFRFRFDFAFAVADAGSPVIHDLPNTTELEHCLCFLIPSVLDALKNLLQVTEQKRTVEAVPVPSYASERGIALSKPNRTETTE